MTEAATNATPLGDASAISVSAEQALSVLTAELQTLNAEKEALERELQEVIIRIHTRAIACNPTSSTPEISNHNSHPHPSTCLNVR